MDLYEYYLAKAFKYLSFRSRSEKEVRDNLAKKKADVATIERIITKLKEKHFLNDVSFAKSWIESRMRTKPKGLAVIKMELKQKGISQAIIEEVLSSGDTVLQSDRETAAILVEKRMKKYIGLEKQQIYQKLGGFLGRRGYSYDTIKHVIDEALGKEYNTDEDK